MSKRYQSASQRSLREGEEGKKKSTGSAGYQSASQRSSGEESEEKGKKGSTGSGGYQSGSQRSRVSREDQGEEPGRAGREGGRDPYVALAEAAAAAERRKRRLSERRFVPSEAEFLEEIDAGLLEDVRMPTSRQVGVRLRPTSGTGCSPSLASPACARPRWRGC